MHAIVITEPGGPEVLRWVEVADPRPGPGDVVIDVAAAGVNRADLMQRQGVYPPPPGAPPYPGLECSGTIAAVGSEVTGWRPGDQVCALLAGGGYAEQVAVAADQLLPVPVTTTLIEAAALPETACTVYSNVFMGARLTSGQTLLIHGGGSGIGTMAIQLAKDAGAIVAVTAGSAQKLDACAKLGADIIINYRDEDFVSALKDATDGRGADVILDIVGAAYLARNIAALAPDGRIANIGMQQGRKGELDFSALMGKRGTITSTTLRARPADQKAQIVAAVRENVWPLIEAGTIRPVIDRELPMTRAAEAHQVMTDSTHLGKILLRRDHPQAPDSVLVMSDEISPQDQGRPQVVVVGPDGVAFGSGQEEAETGSAERPITEMVEQPAKVMRIGSMIRQLLEEVKSAPLDEKSRARLKEIHQNSIKELEDGLAPELVAELERLSLPFEDETPSEAELRVAQAQLVGWLEGLFHGIQTTLFAQQMAARAQLEQMRRALPPGLMPAHEQEQSNRGSGPYL